MRSTISNAFWTMNLAEKVIDSCRSLVKAIDDQFECMLSRSDAWMQLQIGEVSLQQTLVEKNGKGPHGYGMFFFTMFFLFETIFIVLSIL